MSARITTGFARLRRYAWLALALSGFSVPASAGSDALAQQRAKFMLVWETAQHGPEGAWRKLAEGLEDYPLYAYLQLADMQRQLAHLQPDEARKFLDAWPDSLPAQTLREAFLFELARRKDCSQVYIRKGEFSLRLEKKQPASYVQ